MKIGDVFFDEYTQDFYKSESDGLDSPQDCGDCAMRFTDCNGRICGIDTNISINYIRATRNEYLDFIAKVLVCASAKGERIAEEAISESEVTAVLHTRKLNLKAPQPKGGK